MLVILIIISFNLEIIVHVHLLIHVTYTLQSVTGQVCAKELECFVFYKVLDQCYHVLSHKYMYNTIMMNLKCMADDIIIAMYTYIFYMLSSIGTCVIVIIPADSFV